ncbi:hypothetical protein B0H16DRAFT_202784 [Mycena metata]|uniref:Secreted protein n=1 Tax=Mycena metata TaxID=1033252 RepID=A0AAD7HZC4_9AGAR|nr:hypothetical protein B0H16DRAFT_202784 [Mycena metata]
MDGSVVRVLLAVFFCTGFLPGRPNDLRHQAERNVGSIICGSSAFFFRRVRLQALTPLDAEQSSPVWRGRVSSICLPLDVAEVQAPCAGNTPLLCPRRETLHICCISLRLEMYVRSSNSPQQPSCTRMRIGGRYTARSVRASQTLPSRSFCSCHVFLLARILRLCDDRDLRKGR